jgi:hypothetical protein
MQDLIKTGTILIKERTALPSGLSVATATYAGGWDAVQSLDGYALGRTLHNAGWTFFCLAGETSSTTFRFGREKSIRTALGRILKKLKLEKFNSIEITEMVSKHFCGIPYLKLSARSRHIQHSAIIFQTEDVSIPDRSLLVAA